MIYNQLGKTGVKISALGFGAMRLPVIETGTKTLFDHEKSIELMRKAFELGINYFDTAPAYCDGESEAIVGKAIKGIRKDIYLSTKNPIENNSGSDWMKRLEKSLKNLDTDYIDFYHMWGISWQSFVDNINVKDGPMEAAFKARDKGLIRHISFSFHDKAENMIKIIDTGMFETVLCQYNLMDRSNEKGMEHAKNKGLGVIVMGPVGGGRLGAPSQTIQNLLPGRIKSSAQIALRFVLSNPSVDCALSGMGSLAMLEENVSTASNENPLSMDEIETVNEAMNENRKLEGLYCTGCNYCMPCPYDVNIPLNFRLMNYHRVYNITDYAKNEYASIGKIPWMQGKNAGECTGCGVCESKCPQKIEIRKQLKETAEILG